jgi:pimeloyl-ACP methyl ester carboxylesterase
VPIDDVLPAADEGIAIERTAEAVRDDHAVHIAVARLQRIKEHPLLHRTQLVRIFDARVYDRNRLMEMWEDAVVFGTPPSLVGVVTMPSATTRASQRTGVVFLNAGLVHRVGPNRLYVVLARRFAALGYPCLRFDHSGIGDSPAADDGRPFGERFVEEVRAAMDWFAAAHECERFVLVGLCSGTLTAFHTALVDHRVNGLLLLTALLQDPSTVPPEVVAEASDRRVARSYVTAKATSSTAWKRVLTGQANYRNVLQTGARLVTRQPRPRSVDPDVARVIADLSALVNRGVRVKFVFAEPTTVLEYFRMTLEADVTELPLVDLTVMKRSDHTFSRQEDQKRLADAVSAWLAGTSPNT